VQLSDLKLELGNRGKRVGAMGRSVLAQIKSVPVPNISKKAALAARFAITAPPIFALLMGLISLANRV
jgi:hypothetical protein